MKSTLRWAGRAATWGGLSTLDTRPSRAYDLSNAGKRYAMAAADADYNGYWLAEMMTGDEADAWKDEMKDRMADGD